MSYWGLDNYHFLSIGSCPSRRIIYCLFQCLLLLWKFMQIRSTWTMPTLLALWLIIIGWKKQFRAINGIFLCFFLVAEEILEQVSSFNNYTSSVAWKKSTSSFNPYFYSPERDKKLKFDMDNPSHFSCNCWKFHELTSKYLRAVIILSELAKIKIC